MDSREKEIYKVTLIGTAVNAVLIVLKFVAGIVGAVPRWWLMPSIHLVTL